MERNEVWKIFQIHSAPVLCMRTATDINLEGGACLVRVGVQIQWLKERRAISLPAP